MSFAASVPGVNKCARVTISFHGSEQSRTVRRLFGARELTVEGGNIDDNAFGVEPGRKTVETDLARGHLEGDAVVKMVARLYRDVLKIGLQLADGSLLGDRSVAGHDDIDVEAQNVIKSFDPIGNGARPDNGMTADEKKIPGE